MQSQESRNIYNDGTFYSEKVLLCIDPGVTTGVTILHRGKPIFAEHVLRDPKRLGDIVKNSLSAYGEKLEVVIEDFIGAGQRNSNISYTLRILGWVSLFCEYLGMPVHLQPPQFRKSRVKHAKKLLDLHGFGKLRHAADSLAHGLIHIELVKNGGRT